MIELGKSLGKDLGWSSSQQKHVELHCRDSISISLHSNLKFHNFLNEGIPMDYACDL